MLIGRPHLHFRTVGSTNDEARELAAAGAPGGTLVTAEGQTAARGRQGRPWSSPAGSAVAWSFVLREPIEVPSTLPLRIGVGVCQAVESLGVERAEVKWPNDIWIGGRKCAGILVEARPQEGWAVAGVGLNLSIADDEFPPELRGRATSVGHGATFTGAIQALNRCVAACLEGPEAETMTEFADRDALRGRSVTWGGPGDAAGGETGVAVGIGPGGDLLVESRAGCITELNAGEVHLMPREGSA